MYQRITKWLPACFVLSAFVCTLSTCVNVTAKTSPEQAKLNISKETREMNITDITSIINECNETFRTEMSYIEFLNKSGSFPDEIDKTAQCFVRCLLEKSNVISEEGVFAADLAPAFFAAERAHTTEEDFKNSTDACSERNETCICEKSYQFVKCVVQMELKKYDKLRAMY